MPSTPVPPVPNAWIGDLAVLVLFLGAFLVVLAVMGGVATLLGRLGASLANRRDAKHAKQMVIRRRQAWLEECERVRPISRRQK